MDNPLLAWERETELSLAMIALLRADGAVALARAERHRDAWQGRAITFAACSLFLHEPGRGMEIYGGVPGFEAMASSDSVESHFLRGVSAMFMRKAKDALASLERAAQLAPDDPFVAFAMLALTTGPSWPPAARVAALEQWSKYTNHPLAGAAAIMFRA